MIGGGIISTRIAGNRQGRTIYPFPKTSVTVRKRKICTPMPKAGHVEPDVFWPLTGKAIWCKTKVPVINGKLGFFQENKSERGGRRGDLGSFLIHMIAGETVVRRANIFTAHVTAHRITTNAERDSGQTPGVGAGVSRTTIDACVPIEGI